MASSKAFFEWTSFNVEEPEPRRTPSSKPRSRRISSSFFDDCPMDERANDIEQQRSQRRQQQQQRHHQQLQALQQQQMLQQQRRQQQQQQQQALEQRNLQLQRQREQQQRQQQQQRAYQQQQQQRSQQRKNNVKVVMEKQMEDIEIVLSDAQSQLSKSKRLQSQSSTLSASSRSRSNRRYHSMAGEEEEEDQVTQAIVNRLRELRRQSVLGGLNRATPQQASNGRSPPSAPVRTAPRSQPQTNPRPSSTRSQPQTNPRPSSTRSQPQTNSRPASTRSQPQTNSRPSSTRSQPQTNSRPSSTFAPQFHPVPPPPPTPPPKRNYPADSPSGGTYGDSDESSGSSQESSEDMENKRTVKKSNMLKLSLVTIAVVLVVAIGYLLGQWMQRSRLSKNMQQAQSPTVSPVVLMPTNGAGEHTPVIGYDYTANSEFLVAVYYYPWHNQNFHNGGGYMRKELIPRHVPALGEYNDSDPAVIAQHMEWFRQSNIGLLVTSWWGPDRHEDKVTKDVVMEHEEVGNLKIALHYETTGRIGKQGEKLITNAKPDIQYMCENYFDHPNYYKIDGRPVLFIYISRHLDTIGVLDEALLTMRSTASKCGHNLYLIGDSVFESAPDPNEPHIPFWYFDAVTNYDVYGSAGRPEGHAGTNAVDNYYKNQAEWKAQALQEDCRYIPAVSPGYNDRGVRMQSDHPPLSRRITSTSQEGSLFHYQLKQAKELVDPEADKMILVNSFNEWHEDTQIEPVVGDPATEPFNFTKGLEYVGYGNLYLDILRAATSKDPQDHVIYDGLF